MKTISKDILKKAASKLLFDMTEAQYALLEDEFGTLLSQMDLIGKIPDIDSVAPMTFPFDTGNAFMREDVPEAPALVSDILKNAGHVEDDQIKLPKVVG